MKDSSDLKDQVVYHSIMAELHRLQAITINLRTLDDPYTSEALSDHFRREQSLVLGKLAEWRRRCPAIHASASEDFKRLSG
jgi:hypothetical protein